METIKDIFKIGYGPSSSHTMGPARAAKIFLNRNLDATTFKCILYGSLARTGKGHLTDYIIKKTFNNKPIEIIFDFDKTYNYHPNAMKFIAYQDHKKIDEWLVFSVGGGTLKELNEPRTLTDATIYPHHLMNDILKYTKDLKMGLDEYVEKYDEKDLDEYLLAILKQFKKTINQGLYASDILPGGLQVQRKAPLFYQKFLSNPTLELLTYTYALAMSEENASGNLVVTAPTCGSCGVVPAVILSYQKMNEVSDEKLIKALKVAGLIGNLAKTNASISGAEVGCQGEIGVACAMSAAAISYLKGASNEIIEYAAEIALEHHLGMTCDPVKGLVQIPCIERNAIAAMQANNASDYAILAGNKHNVTLDSVIEVMNETGHDLHTKYRETATGGLAIHQKK